jgi:hypothetical protein
LRRFASISSPLDSWTRRYPRRCSETISANVATNFGRRCRSVGSSGRRDVAALAVHIMTNTALTGATYDIDGGQQFVW